MKKVLKVIVNIFAWLVVFLALIVTILVFSSTRSNGVANLLGYIPLTVESQSMSPTFDQGDLIICKQIDDPTALQVDDVITFWMIIDGQKVKNTHRIIEISNEDGVLSFTTRGDNNPIADTDPTYPADLIGKIMAFLRTKVGFFVCILIPMAIFFLIELYKFIVTLIEVKRPATEPQLDEEEIKRRAIEEYLAAQKQKEEEAAKTAEKPAEEAAPAEKPAEAAEAPAAVTPAAETAEATAPAAEDAPAPAEEH